MLSLWFVQALGKILARIEESKVQIICNLLGDLLYYIPNSRSQVILSNLKHAFPDKGNADIRKIARENSRQLMEYGALALATPYFSDKRCLEMIAVSHETREKAVSIAKSGEPFILLGCHTTMNECNTFLPHLIPEFSNVEIGIIYRALEHKRLDEWIKKSRSRFGGKLLARKQGLIASGKLLRNKQCLSILFDQNAGKVGTLITKFGRIASATELPGLYQHKFETKAYISNMRRTAFWRAEYHIYEIEKGEHVLEPVIRAHQWLENYLSKNDEQCADWLWSHKRWKTQNEPHARFTINQKKNGLEKDREFRGVAAFPKKTKLWIRLPNWLGDIVMSMPVIREIEKSRPDLAITLFAPPAYTPWIRKTFPQMETVGLPPKGWRRFLFFYKARTECIDIFLLFTNSQRGDIEAYLTRASQRFGIMFNKKRLLLTHSYKVPEDVDWSSTHQSELNAELMKYFGLQSEISNQPFDTFEVDGASAGSVKVSILYGSDNSPEKRWPASCWREFIAKLLALSPKPEIYIFGTNKDLELSQEIIQTLPREHIHNLTGKTNILEFAEHLASSSLVISNDSGGLHLASSLGTPIVGLYGPTNPIRTGPFFNSAKEIIQPENCPSTGGGLIENISADQVFAKCKQYLR